MFEPPEKLRKSQTCGVFCHLNPMVSSIIGFSSGMLTSGMGKFPLPDGCAASGSTPRFPLALRRCPRYQPTANPDASDCVRPLAGDGVGAHAVRHDQAPVLVGIGRGGVRVIRVPLVASEHLIREGLRVAEAPELARSGRGVQSGTSGIAKYRKARSLRAFV
jgi:hypothetical protein